jgi:ribosomal protein S18 acetylase RimI-like enzyme
MVSKQELKEIIRRRELFIGLYNQEIIGFIGQHLEGSIGLLEIFPTYRGNGYGTELESYLIAHMLKKV